MQRNDQLEAFTCNSFFIVVALLLSASIFASLASRDEICRSAWSYFVETSANST